MGVHTAELLQDPPRSFTAAQNKQRQHLLIYLTHVHRKTKTKSEHWFHKRSNGNLIFRASLPQMNSPFLLKHFLGSRGHRWGHILSFLIRPEGLAADVGAERSSFSWKEIAKASPFTFFKVSQGFGGGYASLCSHGTPSMKWPKYTEKPFISEPCNEPAICTSARQGFLCLKRSLWREIYNSAGKNL